MKTPIQIKEVVQPVEDTTEAYLHGKHIRQKNLTVEVFIPPSQPYDIYALVYGYHSTIRARVFRRYRHSEASKAKDEEAATLIKTLYESDAGSDAEREAATALALMAEGEAFRAYMDGRGRSYYEV